MLGKYLSSLCELFPQGNGCPLGLCLGTEELLFLGSCHSLKMAWNSLVSGTAGEGNQGPKIRIAFLEEENAAMGAELRDLKLSRDNLLQVLSLSLYYVICS